MGKGDPRDDTDTGAAATADVAGRPIPPEEIDDDDSMRPNEAFPLRDDLPGVVVNSPAQQHRDENPRQPGSAVDRGVDDSHVRSPSQGVRPERVADEDTAPD